MWGGGCSRGVPRACRASASTGPGTLQADAARGHRNQSQARPHAQNKETGLKTPKPEAPGVEKILAVHRILLGQPESLEHTVRAHCSDHKTASAVRGSRHKNQSHERTHRGDR